MIQQRRLDIHSFKRSGEVPPADEEEYIMWQYHHMLLTEKEATRALAEYRRGRAIWNEQKKPRRLKSVPAVE